MDSYTLIFVMMEILFIGIVIILSSKMNENIGTFGEIRHFWNIQITFIVGAMTEIIWTLQNAEVLQLTVWMAWIVNGISVISFSVLLFEWFRFIAHRVLRLEEDRITLISMKLQAVIVCLDIIITASSVWTGFVYQIDSAGVYSGGSYYGIHSVFCYSHWLWTTVLIIHYLRKRSLKERKQLYDMFIVSLFPFFGGILQLADNRIPFLDASIMLGTLLIFLNLQQEQITTDALTGLNNRADFIKMYERMLAYAEDSPFVMFVADIDKFKQINDRYGHLAGDRALLLVADTLRKTGGKYHSLYICRYGGDEFVMLGLCKDIRDPDMFVNSINKALGEDVRKEALDFEVVFSIGYQKVDNEGMELKETFEKADAMLYEVKRKK